jgi:hypothetical protein
MTKSTGDAIPLPNANNSLTSIEHSGDIFPGAEARLLFGRQPVVEPMDFKRHFLIQDNFAKEGLDRKKRFFRFFRSYVPEWKLHRGRRSYFSKF